MRTLQQISENAEDLRKFEKDGPQLLLNLRDQALRIVKYLKALTELKNPAYIEKTQPQLYFFELDEGHGNILDLIRDGKYQKVCHQLPSRRKIQHFEVKTFLMRKLSMFLEDDKIMFLPKQPADILKALQMCGRNPYMKFSVQEIGIFEKMIEVLKPRSESEEQ